MDSKEKMLEEALTGVRMSDLKNIIVSAVSILDETEVKKVVELINVVKYKPRNHSTIVRSIPAPKQPPKRNG